MDDLVRPESFHKLLPFIAEKGSIFLVYDVLNVNPSAAENRHMSHKFTIIPICNARVQVSNANRNLLALQST